MNIHLLRQRSVAETFCDVAITVKFYCECDVTKSFCNMPQMTELIVVKKGPRKMITVEIACYVQSDLYCVSVPVVISCWTALYTEDWSNCA